MPYIAALCSLPLAAGALASIVPYSGVVGPDGRPVPWGNPIDTPNGVSYTVCTGCATTTNTIILNETGPTGGDLRTFGGPASTINPYTAAAGGITRTVTDSATLNGASGYNIRIAITGSGNLFPPNLTYQGQPLPNIGIGLGMNLGSAGNAPLWFPPENRVIGATLTFNRLSGTNPMAFDLEPTGFFGAPNQWLGTIGLIVTNGASSANAADPIVQVVWTITTVPTPGGFCALAAVGLFAGRRRRVG